MKKYIITAILFINVIQIIQAQGKYYLPPDLKCETVITEPLNLRKGYLRASVGYAFTPVTQYFDDETGRTRLTNRSNDWHISGYSSFINYYIFQAAYGISDRLNVGFSLPYRYSEGTRLINIEYVPLNEISNYEKYIYEKGFGDLNLSLGYQIIQKNNFYSKLGIDIGLPTGSMKTDTIENNDYLEIRDPVGSNRYDLTVDASFKKVIYPWALCFSPYYSYYFANKRWEPSSKISFSGYWGILLSSWFSVQNEWHFFYIPKYESKVLDYANEDIYVLYSGIMIKQQVKQFRFNQLIKFPLKGSNGYSSDMYTLFSISYTF